jgi:hypothetical protein
MNCVCPVYLHFVLSRGLDVVNHVYPFNDQDVLFQFDIATDVAYNTRWPRVNLARIQRTAECSGQSTTGSGDDVIKGRGMRF